MFVKEVSCAQQGSIIKDVFWIYGKMYHYYSLQSHEPTEIITQETFNIINVENSCAA